MNKFKIQPEDLVLFYNLKNKSILSKFTELFQIKFINHNALGAKSVSYKETYKKIFNYSYSLSGEIIDAKILTVSLTERNIAAYNNIHYDNNIFCITFNNTILNEMNIEYKPMEMQNYIKEWAWTNRPMTIENLNKANEDWYNDYLYECDHKYDIITCKDYSYEELKNLLLQAKIL